MEHGKASFVLKGPKKAVRKGQDLFLERPRSFGEQPPGVAPEKGCGKDLPGH
jgi:hypothetical protein